MALAAAERSGGVIINADASQVYRDLSVLTARPSADDLARAEHRLFGHVDGANACTAARWAAEASAEIAAAHAAGRLPVLVGGTGLYIRTLLDGIAPVPDIDPAVRAAVRALPVDDAHRALLHEDAAAALRLNAGDTTRVQRALEVIRSTGRSLTEWQRERYGGIGERIALRPVILLPDRDWLIDRCARRFHMMLDAGAIEEVASLLARDLPPQMPVMNAIGVRPISEWLRGEIDRSAMIERAVIDTRRYAKRQYTWFRNQPPVTWTRIMVNDNEAKAADGVIKLLI